VHYIVHPCEITILTWLVARASRPWVVRTIVMSVSIVLVDDHAILREGLRLLLERQGDMEIVGEASDGRQALEVVARVHPDVVLMDVTMPNLNGIGATADILRVQPGIHVLALSAHADRRFVKEMLSAGARGYLLKDTAGDNLIEAIHTVMAGNVYLSPKVAGLVVEGFTDLWGDDAGPGPGGTQAQHGGFASLTVREKELLQLLAEGKSNKQAAAVLRLSVKTVDARRRSIMDKLGVSSMAEMTKIAIREGLTSVDF